MSEAKHTSGPWQISYKKNLTTTGSTWAIHDRDRFPSAFVPAWDDPKPGEIDGAEEAKANAHLIAAAPDLLAALEELHALVWGECPSLLNEDSGGDARLDMAIRDALAKARATTPASSPETQAPGRKEGV